MRRMAEEAKTDLRVEIGDWRHADRQTSSGGSGRLIRRDGWDEPSAISGTVSKSKLPYKDWLDCGWSACNHGGGQIDAVNHETVEAYLMVKRNPESEIRNPKSGMASGGCVSRRTFLKGTFGAVVGASFAKGTLAKVSAAETKKSRVVLMRDPAYFKNRKVDVAVARKMVDRLICKLTGKSSVSEAWRTLFSPKERIAIKVNCLFPPVTTNPDTVQAMVESMASAGLDPRRIIIFDRSDGDLRKCGFRLNDSSKGAKCYGTKEYVYPANLRGVDTKISKILAEEVDALINVPVLKNHGIAGITASLKNHLGTVPNAGALHPDNCSRLAELNALDPIRKKTRLIILDGARAQYDRGPSFSPAYFWSYSGMMASTDTVAIDTIAAKEILAKRRCVHP